MKTIKLALLALFLGLTATVSAQNNAVGQVVADVGANPENTAPIVEAAVRQAPANVHVIVEALLAAYPELAEEIIFGAITGMPTPLEEEVVSMIVERAVLFRPELANEIALGARRATSGMDAVINRAAVRALRLIAMDPRRRGISSGQTTAHSIPGVFVDGSILSPAR